MKPERWSAIDELFSRALEMAPGERRAFLDRSCGDDAALRAEVEELLAADERARTFLESPAAPTFLDGDAEEPPAGARFGPYRIERLLGRGGMGTVWLATRDDGQFERQVALKLLHHGAGDPEALQRFRAERQILARLEHPAIARLYDGGETADGVPFLVMEYVEGLPLDVYCDRRLGLEDRLRLFRRLLDAVAYAHQNLLVHRDIKPQNILVTAQGEPKLLDFGIAKQLVEAAGGAEPAEPIPTGLRPMTPSYASPEQVRREAVTTASDIYSLGVVLYELLCGRSPYRLESGLPHELEAAILDQEPEKPSQALARAEPHGPPLEEICAARRARPRELRRRLTGDLDTLALTALRKEPQRRYRSIVELAADIDNHLRNLPIAARPDTVLYRTGKLVRRHRLAVATAGAALLVMAALFGSLLQQRDRAERERDKSREALDFLVDVLKSADPDEKRAANVSARELFKTGARRVSEEHAGNPAVQAALMDAIGQASFSLGQIKDAAPLLEKALALRRQIAPDSLDLAASLQSVAWLKVAQDDLAAAEKLIGESLALRQRLLGHDAREVADSLASLAMIVRDDLAQAERLNRHALQIRRKRLGLRHRDTLRSEEALAQALIQQSRLVMLDQARLAEAEELLHHALAVQREILAQPHPDIAYTVHDLAWLRSLLGDYAGAEVRFREALALSRAIWGEAHVETTIPLRNVGSALLEQGTVKKLKEAEHLFETALSIQRSVHGERHIEVANNLELLARARSALGRHDEALEGARQALDLKRGLLQAEDPDLARPLRDLGIVLLDAHRPSEAEPYLRQSLDLLRRTRLPGYFETARIEVLLGACLTELGRYAEAEPLLRQGTRRLEEQLPAGHKLIREARDKTAALQRARADALRHYGNAEV